MLSHNWVRWNLATGLLGVVLFVAGLARAGVTAPPSPEKSDTAQGELEFRLYCAQCHGMEALGNGPVAPALRHKPANLRLLAKKDGGVFPEQKVRDFIDGAMQTAAHGDREMPIWGLAFRRHGGPLGDIHGNPQEVNAEVEHRINVLVDYLKSIQSQ